MAQPPTAVTTSSRAPKLLRVSAADLIEMPRPWRASAIQAVVSAATPTAAKANTSAMGVAIVGHEIDSSRERRRRRFEIQVVLLQGADHAMDRVGAKEWFLRECSLKFTNGVGALALTLIGQAEQVAGPS